MKPLRLVSDTKRLETVEGTYPYGKNGIWDRNSQSVQNEPGFLPSSVNIPYTPMGVIETDTYPIIFSTDNLHSAIGFFDVDTDHYDPIMNDASLSYRFNFNLSRPIKGEARRNFLNQIEITWFEFNDNSGNTNPPRFLNTVVPGTSINDYLLFPQCDFPKIDMEMGPGGNLGMGGYFVACRYLKKDGTQTRYGVLSAPLFATDNFYGTLPGTNTGKALTINLTEVDTRFDFMIICVVQRINGVDTPFELPEIPVGATMQYIYTGSEQTTQITMDEVLVPGAFYENIQAMTQLDDTLYMGNITEEDIIDYQQYANLVKLRWNSSPLTVGTHPVPLNDSGKQRGFMHQEVYAFYIVLKLNTGRNTRAFIIPGPAPISSDTATSTLGTAQGMTEPKYMLEDTVKNIDPTTNSGDFGIWINQDENYPDTPEFDSSALGGENLRNQPVRHFRTPSLRFCKNNFYLTNNEYGRTVLDTLGLSVTSIQIPPELQERVIGWEIYYAVRNFNNATVLGQSQLLFGAQANGDASRGGSIRSTGGNWGSYQRTHSSGSISDPESLPVLHNYIRFHALDMLISLPSINPTHVSIQLGMQIAWPTTNANTFQNTANQVLFWLDYCNHTPVVSIPNAVADAQALRALDEGQYMVNDEISGFFDNTRLEGCYVAHLPVPGTGLMEPGQWSWMRRDYDQGSNTPPNYEQTYLANLMINRRNVYPAFYSQDIARTGYTFDASQAESDVIIYGGDIFLSYNSFNDYGLVTALDVTPDTGKTDWKTQSTDGIKVVRTFIAETVSNLAARYELPGNIYSKFIPKEATTNGGTGFLGDYSRDTDPNQIGYTKDDNAVGNLLNGIAPASPFDIFVGQSPHKVIRSIKQLAEGQVNNWKNYNALDYFEVVKNKGYIANLQGMGDLLIIHLSEGFYRTRDKEVLNTDLAQITLGSGDIFAITPKEIRPSKLGYAGTQHPLSCYLTAAGYVFPDARTGEIFLYDGEGMNNLSMGIERFLQKYMQGKQTNVFTGNGITIGWDWKYKRILITVKNLNLVIGAVNFVPGWQPTAEFIASLTAGTSIVYIRGRYLLFQGVNTSEFMCDNNPDPTMEDDSFSLDEHLPNGTVIGSMVASDGLAPYYYSILSGNTEGAVGINSATGQLTIINTTLFDWVLTPVLTLTVQAQDTNGNTVSAIAAITLGHVPSTPYIAPQSFAFPSSEPVAYSLGFIAASNRDGGTEAWTILSGNDGTFAINPTTGELTVASTTSYTGITSSLNYTLVIQVTMSGVSNSISIPIMITPVPTAPTYSGPAVFTADHTSPNGTPVGFFPGADVSGPWDYTQLSYNNTPALVLAVGIVGTITINSNTLLSPGADNIFVIQIYNISNPSIFINVTLTIHIT